MEVTVIPLRLKWKLLSEKKLRENRPTNQSVERRWSVIYRSSWSKDITCKRPVPKPNSKHLVLYEVCVTSPSWITALWRRGFWNSMKLWAMPCRATQDGQVIVESSHKMWSTGGGNGKPIQNSCCENPMNSMKRQKDMTLEEEPSQVGRCPICYWGRAEGNY